MGAGSCSTSRTRSTSVIPRGCSCPIAPCQGTCWTRRLTSPSVRRRTPTFSRGTWSSRPEPPGTVWCPPCSTRLGVRPPKVPALPHAFAHLRRELGAQVYGSMGITREDTEGRRIAVLRNWEFFRAPLAGIVCMHSELGKVDALGVGMFLQTLVLALTAQRAGHVRSGLDRGLSRDHPRTARDPDGLFDSVRPGGWLPRPDLPRQQYPHRPQRHRQERGVPRSLMESPTDQPSTRSRLPTTRSLGPAGDILISLVGDEWREPPWPPAWAVVGELPPG